MTQLKSIHLVFMLVIGIMISLVAGTAISSEVKKMPMKSNPAISTQQECILKCQAAKAAILRDGLANVIKKINMKDKTYVSDVTYVFAMKMDGTMLGHPYKPNLIGKKLIDVQDKAGKYFFKEFVKIAREKGSGWVSYMWPKPNEEKPSPKISYILKVNDNVFVGAGIYQ